MSTHISVTLRTLLIDSEKRLNPVDEVPSLGAVHPLLVGSPSHMFLTISTHFSSNKSIQHHYLTLSLNQGTTKG